MYAGACNDSVQLMFHGSSIANIDSVRPSGLFSIYLFLKAGQVFRRHQRHMCGASPLSNVAENTTLVQ